MIGEIFLNLSLILFKSEMKRSGIAGIFYKFGINKEGLTK